MLPEQFKQKMKTILKGEYDEFIASYEKPVRKGIRINPLKASPTTFAEISGIKGLSDIPWCPNGFYIDEDFHPGRNALHDMGVYYVQEPSAMAVGELADIGENEYILDLCAAPGGKTTHIAGKMNGSGVLVSNEINYERAKVLSSNVERLGIKNCIVTSNTPDELYDAFGCFFDKIYADAPCSGEGMFKTKENAISEWSPENVNSCIERAKTIIEPAISMLLPGGTLIYSTCTFEPGENEEMIEYILREYPSMSLCTDIPSHVSLNVSASLTGADGMYRIWPHKQEGEGHFFAVLKKNGERKPQAPKIQKASKKGNINRQIAFFNEFANELGVNMSTDENTFFSIKNDELYLSPLPLLPDGLRVLRNGLKLGSIKKDRFAPDHAYALALSPKHVQNTVEITDPYEYISGNQLNINTDKKGYVLITYKNLPLGFGKAAGGVIKNHYPKGLRRNQAFDAI